MKSASKDDPTSEADLPILLAISGGRDSVALLHWLISQQRGNIILCHLNHGLRGHESDQDAALVRKLAKRHHLPCEISKVNAAAFAKQHRLSVETAGRELRHIFLFKMAAKHGAQRICLAHHADDQAETILANLCRGSALGGLSGMLKETVIMRGEQRLTFERPLLEWRRAEIDSYIKEHHLQFREDSSNVSLKHRRNRLRHEVLPLLNEIYGRDVSPILARFGRHACRDDNALWAPVQQLAADHIAPDGSLMITPSLAQQHPATLTRLLHWWLTEKLGLTGIDNANIEAAAAMLVPGGPAKINLPASLHLRRKAKRLWVCPSNIAP